MRILKATLGWILLTLFSAWLSAAEEITHISLIQTDTGRETALERRLPVGLTHPKIGDRVVLHAGKSGNYIVEVTESRRSKFGNSIVHGVTPSGGSSLLVFSPSGSVIGNLAAYDGKVQIITENGVTTAWRIGIDALSLPIDSGVPTSADGDRFLNREIDETAADRSPITTSLTPRGYSKEEKTYPRFSVGPHQVDLLIYYDSKFNDPTFVIDYVVEIANQALKNSQLSVQASVATVRPLDISEDATIRELRTAMTDRTSPFEELESDSAASKSDIVFFLKDGKTEADEALCGLGAYAVYKGYHRRSQNLGVVAWQQRQLSGGYYCSDESFAHELGHILGGAHDYTDEEFSIGAYSFSNGHYNAGSFGTIMATTSDERVQYFSNPGVLCKGYPCGIAAGRNDAADNARTFRTTAPLVASHESEIFLEDSITAGRIKYGSDCGQESVPDDNFGEFRGNFLRNNSGFEVEIISLVLVLRDGGLSVSDYEGEATLEAGGYFGRGYCRLGDEENPMGTTVVESYITYRNPSSGEVIHTVSIPWDDNYVGDFSSVRVAVSDGGQVEDESDLFLREGSKKSVNFRSDPLFKLDRLETTCDGNRVGDIFQLQVGEDDCRIEAFFARDAVCDTHGTSGAYVQKTFIAYLGRPAAPAGLEYFSNYLDSNMEQGKLILFDDLYYSEEANQLYRDSSLMNQINQFYQFMFSRDALSDGLGYWIDEIKAGLFTIPASAAYIADAASGEDMAVLDAKQVAASKLTCAIGDDSGKLSSFQSNLDAARASLAQVTTAAEASAYDGEAELTRILTGG